MLKYFRDLLPVKPEEAFVTTLMFAYIFGVLTLYYILEPLRAGLFLKKVPSSHLPYMYFLIALVAGAIAIVTFQLGKRVSAIALVTGTNVLIFATLFYFRLVLGQDLGYLPYAFYVYVKIISVLASAQFWLLAGYIYDNRQAKRIYSVLGVGASLGAVAGSAIPAFLSQRLSAESMLLICMTICLGLIALSQRAWRYRRPDAEVRKPKQEGNTTAPWTMILESRHLTWMVTLIFLTLITSQIVDWQLMDGVQRAYRGPDPNDAIGQFFGRFNLITNVLTIAVQFLATGFVVNRLGIFATVVFLPGSLLLASFGIFMVPSMFTAAVARGIDTVARYTVNRAGIEMLYLPLAAAIRKRLKLFLDVFVDRAGRAVAGIVILALTSAYFPYGPRGTAAVSMVLTFFCVLACLQLRKTYVQAFRQQLMRREIELTDVAHFVSDPASVRLLVNALESPGERQIVYSLQLLQSVRGVDFSPQLLPLLHHESAYVREEAIRTLHSLPQDHATNAEPLLADPADGVRIAAIDYLCAQETGGLEPRLESLFKHGNPDVRIAAARWASMHSAAGLQHTVEIVGGLLSLDGSRATHARAAAAAMTVHLPAENATELLRELIADAEPEVAGAAAIAAGKSGHIKLVSNVVRMLPVRQLRGAGRSALVSYGERIVGNLGGLLADQQGSIAVRREIPWVLGRIPVKLSLDLLIANLAVEDALLRLRTVKSLNRLHETNPGLPLPAAAVDSRIQSEARRYYESLAICRAVGGSGILVRALRERLDQKLEVIFRLLGLVYSQKDILSAYVALKGTRIDRRGAAIEFLDNVLHNNLKSLILPLLEETSPDALLERAAVSFKIHVSSRAEAIRGLMAQPDSWLADCARYENGETVTSIERVLLLQEIDLFTSVTTEQLSYMAAIAEEITAEPGKVLYSENDSSDGFYIVVSGAIAVKRGDDAIDRIGAGGSLGVWALFDDQPRMTGAEAMETSHLLFVSRDDFYDVLSDHVDIVQGIFKQLVQRVRRLAAVVEN